MHYLPSIPVLAAPDRVVYTPTLQIGVNDKGGTRSGDVIVRVAYSDPIETADDIRRDLRSAQQSDSIIHPDGSHDILGVFCAPEVQADQLGRVLRLAMEVGFRFCSFACTHNDETSRPILGSLTRLHLTAVNVALRSASGRELHGDKNSTATVSLSHYPTFGDLARRMAELRRADKQVILHLSP